MSHKTIHAYRLSPSGAWELTGLGERRVFYGYSLREAKRVYRMAYRQARLNSSIADTREIRLAEFYTLSGELTPYALACGYVQTYGEHVRLFEDGCFHVQGGGEWETFSTLTEARRAAKQLNKKLSKGNN